MFKDPLKTLSLNGGGALNEELTQAVNFALVDTATPGRSIRTYTVGALSGNLTISHSETKENKPYGTKRVNTRLDASRVDPEGVPVTLFVQMTIGLPKSGFTSAELHQMIEILAGLIVYGDGEAGTNEVVADGQPFRLRLMNGEG